MYKVFLVDDEIVIREGIRTSFPWDKSGFVLSGEAQDGEIALALMQEIKPDILITDIRMPFMDGLELSRKALVNMPWLKVVILTGYDEFTYAREALALGVKEYLLKPVSAHELHEALKRIALQIDEERRRQQDLMSIKTQLDQSAQLIRDQFLCEVVQGTADEVKRSSLFLRARELEMNLLARQYRLMIIAPGRAAAERLPFKALISRLLESRPAGSLYQCQPDGLTTVLFLADSPEEIDEAVFLFAQAVKHEAEQMKMEPLHIAIGAVVNTVFALKDSYRSALVTLQAMSEHLSSMNTQIMDSTDLQLRMVEVLSLAENASLYERLRFAPVSRVGEILGEYFAAVGSGRKSMMMMNFLFVDSMLTAVRLVQELGLDIKEMLPEAIRVEKDCPLFSSEEEMRTNAQEILTRALMIRDRESLSRYSALIRKACAYAEEHFCDPNLTLSDAARHVHLSVNHFCTVFSQETGTTFIEYLTQLRLQRAREMLENTTLRSAEIAPGIGYRDPHYFSYLFKKNIGLSPREYRNRQKTAAP
jgi:two-component system response regulator YesN